MHVINVKTFCLKGLVALSLLTVSVSHVAAQDYTETRIKRDVQPIAYWVESSSLRLRDNPVSGTVVGSLEYGQKVLAYSQYENWVRVSKPGQDAHWVNSDFLSNSRLSWAGYNNSRASSRSSDVVSVRIKDPDDRKNRIFGVRVKSSETGNVLITTRHDKGQGVYFQNRFVSCNNKQAVGVRLVGEGSDFLSTQDDIRNHRVDIHSTETIKDAASNPVESSISEFACKVQDF